MQTPPAATAAATAPSERRRGRNQKLSCRYRHAWLISPLRRVIARPPEAVECASNWGIPPPAGAAPGPVCDADQFRSHWSPDAAPTAQAVLRLIFASEASDPPDLSVGAGGFLPGVPLECFLGIPRSGTAGVWEVQGQKDRGPPGSEITGLVQQAKRCRSRGSAGQGAGDAATLRLFRLRAPDQTVRGHRRSQNELLQGRHIACILADCVGKPTDNVPPDRRP
jgi:hypothetical protein